jgi:hypothetical protein
MIFEGVWGKVAAKEGGKSRKSSAPSHEAEPARRFLLKWFVRREPVLHVIGAGFETELPDSG